MSFSGLIRVGERELSLGSPTLFIADIASNHDGDLARAEELIWLCKEAGADAAKFQHFKADAIVSDRGFRQLGDGQGHQAGWDRSVYDTYAAYELRREWTSQLAAVAAKAEIAFMTTPYDPEAVALAAPLVPAFKIGSGDLTWTSFISLVASQGKPVMLATGASTIADVDRAVRAVSEHTNDLVLMQCNTNYTGDPANFGYVNLRVLETFAERYPGVVLGLSDHTPGHAAVLGAIALGARVVEKHFTDDTSRRGPDHAFSMDPSSWSEMVSRSRELELALGDGTKRIEANEEETVVLQRRAVRVREAMNAGDPLRAESVEMLRPAPHGALQPYEAEGVIGRSLRSSKAAGDELYPCDLE